MKTQPAATPSESLLVQTRLDGQLKDAFVELEETRVPRAELLRQGLIRLAAEYREKGELTIKQLAPA